MKWFLTSPHMAWDTETTGVNTETDYIVTACTVIVDPASKAVDRTSWLLAVDIDIPEEATRVHGITTEHARTHGVSPREALQSIANELALAITSGLPMVGCNLTFDFTILDRNMRRHGLPLFCSHPDEITPVVDVLVLDKHLDPFRRGKRRLSDPKEGGLCQWYGVPMGDAHTAEADALAAGRVAWRIASMTQWSNARLVEHFGDESHLDPESPDYAARLAAARARRARYGNRHRPQDVADRFLALTDITPAALHAAQARWKAEQAVGLREYFTKEGKDVSDIHEAWPLVPYPGGKQ